MDLESFLRILPEEARDINLDLITLALTPKKQDRSRNYESLEFLGDSLLRGILGFILYQSVSQAGPGVMTRLVAEIGSNSFLSCLLRQKGLCLGQKTKYCADILEALTGAIFIHLVEKGENAYKILYEWFTQFWDIPTYLGIYLADIPDPCLRPNPTPMDLENIPAPLMTLPEKSSGYLGSLRRLNLEELDQVRREASRLISLSQEESARTQLQEYYSKNRLGQVIYSYDPKSRITTIPSPFQVGTTLGVGIGGTKAESREMAAKDALARLKA
jgi:dsRNA-specific ribonuclease